MLFGRSVAFYNFVSHGNPAINHGTLFQSRGLTGGLRAQHTPDQIQKWLVMHAQQELAIAGGVDDRRSSENDFGGL
jgi:hypothetical protein